MKVDTCGRGIGLSGKRRSGKASWSFIAICGADLISGLIEVSDLTVSFSSMLVVEFFEIEEGSEAIVFVVLRVSALSCDVAVSISLEASLELASFDEVDIVRVVYLCVVWCKFLMVRKLYSLVEEQGNYSPSDVLRRARAL